MLCVTFVALLLQWCRAKLLLHLVPCLNESVTNDNRPQNSITFATGPSDSVIISVGPNHSTIVGTVPKISAQLVQKIVLQNWLFKNQKLSLKIKRIKIL